MVFPSFDYYFFVTRILIIGSWQKYDKISHGKILLKTITK